MAIAAPVEVLPTLLGQAEEGLRRRHPGADASVPAQVAIPLHTLSMGDPDIDHEKGWSKLREEVSNARKASWSSLRSSFNRFSPKELGLMNTSTRKYYTNLYAHVDQLESDDVEGDSESVESPAGQLGKCGPLMIYVSFICNAVIFGVKISVAIKSGALVVYASALDSFLDLLCGSILAITTWMMAHPNPHKYPIGKSRMEPLGVIVFAAIMGTAYTQVIGEALQRFLEPAEVVCTMPVITMLGGIVGAKALLCIVCRMIIKAAKSKSVALEAQAEDHFNDCITNSFSALGTFFASSYFAQQICGLESDLSLFFIDPIVATLFSSYVIYVWARMAHENIVSFVGKTAPSELLQRITYLAAVHCSEVIAVDTIRAYSFGQKYIAEVDIVLPPQMPNHQVHDISESLQVRIEALEEIERCFVHVDWETTHKPEHKP